MRILSDLPKGNGGLNLKELGKRRRPNHHYLTGVEHLYQALLGHPMRLRIGAQTRESVSDLPCQICSEIHQIHHFLPRQFDDSIISSTIPISWEKCISGGQIPICLRFPHTEGGRDPTRDGVARVTLLDQLVSEYHSLLLGLKGHVQLPPRRIE
jgi:hypothetical protein